MTSSPDHRREPRWALGTTDRPDGGSPHRRRRAPATRALLTVVVLLGGACGGSDDDAGTAAEPTTSPTTTDPTTTLTPEAQDEADIRQLVEAWHSRSNDIYEGRAETSELADYLTGTFLDQIEQRVEDTRSSGQTYETNADARHVVGSIEVDGSDAAVGLCVFQSGTYRSADGEVTDEVSRTFRLETEAVRTDDGWRLSDQHQIGTTEDGDQCPDA